MSQTWVENNEAADGTTVKQGMINLEDKLDTVRSQFSGSAFPTDADREVGQVCWRTDGAESGGVGLYRLKTKAASAIDDVWIFTDPDDELTVFGASLRVLADAAALRTLISVDTLTAGTADGEVQTNSQNATMFAQTANDLSDLNNAATARGHLGLGALSTMTSIGEAELGAGAVTRTKLATVEQSMGHTTKAGTYTAGSMQHVTCNVSSNWILTLPTSPAPGTRVCVYVKSITAGRVLTVEGTSKAILGGVGTTLLMYCQGDRADLSYNGTEWVPQSLYLTPHASQMSAAGFSRSPSTTYSTIPFDTVDFDNASTADTSTERITIRRAGRYQVTARIYDNASSSNLIIYLMKNGSILEEKSFIRHPWSVFSGGIEFSVSDHFTLAAGDYLEFFIKAEIDPFSSLARLTAVEQR